MTGGLAPPPSFDSYAKKVPLLWIFNFDLYKVQTSLIWIGLDYITDHPSKPIQLEIATNVV